MSDYVRVVERRWRVAAAAVAVALVSAVASLAASTTAVRASSSDNWFQMSPTNSPAGRFGFALAYDYATHDAVLFGGDTATFTGSNKVGDTWTWDGSNWTQQSPANSPSPRRDAFMAYDPITQTMILFGGEDQNNNFLHDTWSWNGTNWSQLSPATNPGARSTDGAGFMVYDPAMNEGVLFGGDTGGVGGLTDTWSWNGSTWTQISTGTTSDPPNSTLGGVAYDEAHQQLVYFEGSNQETWLWGPQPGAPQGAWVSAGFQPLAGVTSSSLPAMAYDPSSQTVIVFGGGTYPGAAETATSATWSWDGGSKTWTQLSPSISPSARIGAGMITDDDTGDVYVFGGISPVQSNLNDTWMWDAPPLWGVDSTTQITQTQLNSISSQRGGMPVFYGRYLNAIQNVTFALSSAEVNTAHAQNPPVKVLMIYSDPAGQYNGNGATAAQAAITAAHNLGAPAGVVIVADIEPNVAVTSSYLQGWHDQFTTAPYNYGYVAGFYFNPYPGSSQFSGAYCAASTSIRNSILWSDEPKVAATSKAGAPAFAPANVNCSGINQPSQAWQYTATVSPNIDEDEWNASAGLLW